MARMADATQEVAFPTGGDDADEEMKGEESKLAVARLTLFREGKGNEMNQVECVYDLFAGENRGEQCSRFPHSFLHSPLLT